RARAGTMPAQYTGRPLPIPAPVSPRRHALPVTPSPSDDRVPGLDPAAAARWLRLPRPESPWLHEEVASRMAERLQWFREPPTSWLHWEPMLGGLQGHARVRAVLP